MRRIFILLGLLFVLVAQYSCKKSPVEANFKDLKSASIYDYIVENKADYSSFLSILEKGGIDKTLSAYNPDGTNYTLFLPNNAAVDKFIKNSSQYGSLNDLLNDTKFVQALARIHVLNKGVTTYDFPFGTFSDPTLSEDYLNVGFIFGTDTTFYNINNQARVIKANIEVSNGYIQEIDNMLQPITMNSYGWLKSHSGFSIFLSALDKTGINSIIDVDMKAEGQTLKPFTMLVEPDTVYQKRHINSFEDLANLISPGQTNYTDKNNPMNLFVGYHLLTQSQFLNDFQAMKEATNYNTFADIPLVINGTGIDITINKAKEVFDTIISGIDTTYIDYVGINYDASNVITQSGAIHVIDQILKPQVPSRSVMMFRFLEEQGLNTYRQEGGSFLIDDPKTLEYVTWSGAKLFYVKSTDPAEQAWDKDYMLITGDFTISYQVPKIIAGKYNVVLGANGYSSANALVELYVDGIKLGGLVDLTKGGSANNPYAAYRVGSVDFKKYDSHVITIKSLIPGRLAWDYIRFEPI